MNVEIICSAIYFLLKNKQLCTVVEGKVVYVQILRERVTLSISASLHTSIPHPTFFVLLLHKNSHFKSIIACFWLNHRVIMTVHEFTFTILGL